jgi:hypothetical protein
MIALFTCAYLPSLRLARWILNPALFTSDAVFHFRTTMPSAVARALNSISSTAVCGSVGDGCGVGSEVGVGSGVGSNVGVGTYVDVGSTVGVGDGSGDGLGDGPGEGSSVGSGDVVRLSNFETNTSK